MNRLRVWDVPEFGCAQAKHRQVTDLDLMDLGFSGPRIPFCATGALWGRVMRFSSITFLSIEAVSQGGQSSVTRS